MDDLIKALRRGGRSLVWSESFSLKLTDEQKERLCEVIGDRELWNETFNKIVDELNSKA